MSGASELFVQPCGLAKGGPAAVGEWVRGIPLPSPQTSFVGFTGPPTGVGGIPTCKNLIAASPPTLLEQYEIYSYTIGWGVYVLNTAGDAFVDAPIVDVELALLLNDRPAYQSRQRTDSELFANNAAFASDAWISDLVNPVEVGARDRLSLRAAVRSNLAASVNLAILVGVQLNPGSLIPFESTISYRVTNLPGARRL